MNLIKYLKEIEYMKYYILAASVPLFLFYSMYVYLDENTLSKLTEEDRFFEWATVLFFLAAAIIGLRLFRITKNAFFILFFIAFFFAAGEEISWGQRIFGYETPAAIKEKNVQQEFTIHNLEMFNQMYLNGESKKGLSRLFEMNFLFRIGTFGYGILLPLLVCHLSFIRSFTKRIKIPVPPVSAGFFFFLNWVTYKMVYSSMTSYKQGGSEIFECTGALIVFLICLFFLLERKKINYFGADLKEAFETRSYLEALPGIQQ